MELIKIKFERIFIFKNNEFVQIDNNFDINSLYTELKIYEPLFIYNNKGDLYFSKNCKNFFDKGLSENIVYKNLDSYGQNGLFATNETIYKNIIFTSSKFKVEVIEDQLSIRLLFPNSYNPFKSSMDFNNDFFHVLKRLSDTDKIYLLFSGGADSLFLFFHLLELKKKFTCLTVKMNGFEKDFIFSKKICEYYNIEFIELKFEDNIISENIDEILTKTKEPISDEIAPVYYEILKNYSQLNKNKKTVFIDGQGADTVLLGLPHHLLLKLYNPYLSKIFYLINKLAPQIDDKSSNLKRFYYRIKKTVSSFSEPNWKRCFLSLIEADNNQLKYFEIILDNAYKNYNCKFKSVAFFFLICILDRREMQKYRYFKNKNVDLLLPFMKKEIIDRAFSTKTNFFISYFSKKKPIYEYIKIKNTFKTKKNKSTAPFYYTFKIHKKKQNILKYCKDKIYEKIGNNL